MIRLNQLRAFGVLLLAVPFAGCDDNCATCDSPTYNYTMQLYDLQEEPAQRRVNILFQVLESETSEGALNGVGGLTESDFIVLENGNPIDTEAEKTIDPQSIPSNIRTVLLLDVSSSVADFITQLKEASVGLVDQKLPNQEIALFVFDKETRLVQDFTSDKELLISQINALPEDNLESSTNLYGAIIKVTNGSYFSWDERYSIESILEHNMVLFTDGRHNANPDITLEQALASIDTKKVFVAALQSADLQPEPLRELATESYLVAQDIHEVKQNFKKVQKRIVDLSNSLYYLYYTSPISEPSSRKNTLEIQVANNREGENNSIVAEFNSEGFR